MLLSSLLPSRFDVLVLVNAILQVADGLGTLLGMRRGVAEGNPIVAFAMDHLGTAGGLMLMKTAALIALAFVYRYGRRPGVELGLASIAVLYLVLAVVPWSLVLLAA